MSKQLGWLLEVGGRVRRGSVGVVHPMEYLRAVVGSQETSDRDLVRECARGVSAFIDDPVELVPVCQRLVAHQPQSAALVWFCARLLSAFDPRDELGAVVAEMRLDATGRILASALPDEGTVAIVGGDDLVHDAVRERPDLCFVVVDSLGLPGRLVRRLERADVLVEQVSAESVGVAAAAADLVVVEATAAAPDRIVALCGGRAALAVANAYQRSSVVAIGRGRSMRGPMLDGFIARMGDKVDTRCATHETVPLSLAGGVVDHRGRRARLVEVDTPDVPELR